jgi:Zn-dependent alcohol dehydrogenase
MPDLMIKDGDFHSPLPLTGSHEPCGTVESVGSKVKGFKKGDRVGTLPFMHPCGECPDCKAGSYIYCDNMKGAMGINTNGAFAEVQPRASPVSLETLMGGSISCVIRPRRSIYRIRFRLNRLRRYFVRGQRFTVRSRGQISRRVMSLGLSG